MAISWKTFLNIAPRIALGFLPGIAAPGNGIVRAATRTLPSSLKGGAFVYPDLGKEFWYMQDTEKGGQGTTINGHETWLPALNSSLDRNNLGAGLAQSLQEHNQAIAGGYEKTLEEWWPDEDVRPRKEFNPSSSAVKSVKITTDGKIQVQWHGKNGKWYTYRGGKDLRDTSRIVMDLLSSPSIGRALIRKGEKAWPNSRHLNANGDVDETIGVPDPNIGFWGRKHFDPTWAGGRMGSMIG